MTTSRERFEPGPWPSKLTAGDGCFYNTTSETGPKLAECQAKAGEQNMVVLGIFQNVRWPLSPSQVLQLWPVFRVKPPLTSIRRAITTLTKAGALQKTELARKGIYGRREFCWQLPEAQSPDRVVSDRRSSQALDRHD